MVCDWTPCQGCEEFGTELCMCCTYGENFKESEDKSEDNPYKAYRYTTSNIEEN